MDATLLLFPIFCTWFGFPLDFATGVAIAGVQIHHFFVDGVIWKLRNPAVAAPLMGSFSDLLKLLATGEACGVPRETNSASSSLYIRMFAEKPSVTNASYCIPLPEISSLDSSPTKPPAM
ncbi:MAG: hypothetical protein R3B54_00185 [Bdellovibrionota bacterium]